MSYIAGHLLLYLTPYMAFSVFANLIEHSPFFHAFFKVDMKQMRTRYKLFEDLFQGVRTRTLRALPKGRAVRLSYSHGMGHDTLLQAFKLVLVNGSSSFWKCA